MPGENGADEEQKCEVVLHRITLPSDLSPAQNWQLLKKIARRIEEGSRDPDAGHTSLKELEKEHKELTERLAAAIKRQAAAAEASKKLADEMEEENKTLSAENAILTMRIQELANQLKAFEERLSAVS